MFDRFVARVVALGLPAFLVFTLGCEDRAVAPSRPPEGEQVNGIVYDSALRPLSGATVSALDGPLAGKSATTGPSGGFSLWVPVDDTTRFSASKAGHVTRTGTLEPYCGRCHPAWSIYFYLESVATPVNLAGDYTLTLTADTVCGSLPQEVRSRTYAATIAPASDPTYPPNATFELSVPGTPFLKGYERFLIHVAGDYIAIPLGDLHGDPGFVEILAPNTYVAFSGWMAAAGMNASTISMSLDGSVDYCALRSEMGSPYECLPEQAIASTFCASKNHQLLLTRR